MKVNEIFESIQGEGRLIGQPSLFVRLSGCTRACDFCDTKYHTQGRETSIEEVVKGIKMSSLDNIVWTGGEPMLWEDDIYSVIYETLNKHHMLETNGDILPQFPKLFHYISFSPKTEVVAEKVYNYIQADKTPCKKIKKVDWDIKVVTDLELNKELIKYATMLMPLTTGEKEKDLKTQQNIWNYCVKNNIKYTPRIHVDVWGKKKGI